MYRAKTLIVHADTAYVCPEGGSLDKCPPKLLKQLIQDGLVTVIDGAAPDEMLITDQDVLSRLGRKELIKVLQLNMLVNTVGARSTWTDEQIRQGIRNVTPDVDKLVLSKEDLTLLDEKALGDETDPASNGDK